MLQAGMCCCAGCHLGAQGEGLFSCESLPAEAAFGPWVLPGHRRSQHKPEEADTVDRDELLQVTRQVIHI